MYMNIPKSRLFKWIGGKSWMTNQLSEVVGESLGKNTGINTYVEPFVGGMGAFFAIFPLLNKNGVERIVLNDINSTLIGTLDNVKSNPDKLIVEFGKLDNELSNLMPELVTKGEEEVELSGLHGVKDKELIKESLVGARDFFNAVRLDFNEAKKEGDCGVENSARFLFLMAHCFNGVYRESAKTGYNVPFNWSNKKPNTDRKAEIIREYSDFFNGNHVIFENLDAFELIEKYGKSGCFYYMDPPYMNEGITENKYSEGGFDADAQLRLIDESLSMNGMAYSNHNLESIKQKFEDANVAHKELFRKNIMAASAKSRETDLAEILAWS